MVSRQMNRLSDSTRLIFLGNSDESLRPAESFRRQASRASARKSIFIFIFFKKKKEEEEEEISRQTNAKMSLVYVSKLSDSSKLNGATS